MLVVLKLLKMAGYGQGGKSRGTSDGQTAARQQRSYYFKRGLFILSLVCTCGLCVFFIKHRVYCHDMGESPARLWIPPLLTLSSFPSSQPSVGSRSASTGLLQPTWVSMPQ